MRSLWILFISCALGAILQLAAACGDGDTPLIDDTCVGDSCTQGCNGSSCDLSCREGNCTQRCVEEGCTMSCTGGNCSQSCASGSRCESSCTGGGCSQRCEAGADCSFRCSGAGCVQMCAATAARCELSCGSGCTVDRPGGPPDNGQVTSCTSLCDLTPVATSAQANCVGAAMTVRGYDVAGTASCQRISTVQQCNACYLQLRADDSDCVGAHAACF